MDFSDRHRRRWLIALVLSGLGLIPAVIDLATGTLLRVPLGDWFRALDLERDPGGSFASIWTWIALTGLAPLYVVALRRIIAGGPYAPRSYESPPIDVRRWAICAAVGLVLLPFAAGTLYVLEILAQGWKTSGVQFRDSFAMYLALPWLASPAVMGIGFIQRLVYGKHPRRWRKEQPELPSDL